MIFAETYPTNLTVIQRATLTSTNTYIRENLSRLRNDIPLMVVASEQTDGRGRENRQWYSAEGLGLYTSFAFEVRDKEILPFLALTTGLAVIDSLIKWGIPASRLQLKWPNDILCDRKKMAGILIENIVAPKELISICGIGINLNHGSHDFPPDLSAGATSFNLAIKSHLAPLDVSPSLARHFFHWLSRLEKNNRALIVKKCNQYSRFMRNRKITLSHQNKSLRGVFMGINGDGGLLIKGNNGTISCHYSGEILEVPVNPD